MAKIIITIQDNKDGSVKVTSNPNFLDIMRMTREVKLRLTAAHSYAMTALNAMRDSSKLLDKLNKGVTDDRKS
jgi:hypothetical protein